MSEHDGSLKSVPLIRHHEGAERVVAVALWILSITARFSQAHAPKWCLSKHFMTIASAPATSMGIGFDVVTIRATIFSVFPRAQQTAAILQKRESDARDKRAVRAADARRIVQQIIREHVKPPAQMWLIGSLAWGEFGEHSDVDLVFSGVDRALALQVENEVAQAIGAPVDVLDLHQLPNSFRDRILQTGLKLV